MNQQQQILVQRLKEAELSTQRFLKVGDGKLHVTPKHPEGEYLDKAAFEKDFQNHLYNPEDLDSYPRWGIIGKDSLVLLDFDTQEIYDIMKKRLPDTFEVTSPKRGLQHRYYIVCGKQVENGKFHIQGDIDEKGHKNPCGEIRANDLYLVAPGTLIRFEDAKTGQWLTGTYTITNNIPFTRIKYSDFIEAVKPYLLDKIGEKVLTNEMLENGVSKGHRHDTIFRYACRLMGDNPEGRFPASIGLDILRRYNQNKLSDPVEDEFCVRVINQACEYASKETGIPAEKIAELGFSGIKQKCLSELAPLETKDYQDENKTFNPNKYAQKLMQNYFFRTDKKTELMYVYDLKTGVWYPEGEIFIHVSLVENLGQEVKPHYLPDVIFYIKGVTYQDLQETPKLIALENGILNVVTHERLDPNPGYFILSKIRVKYDVTADCPKIKDFLKDVFGEQQLLALQEAIGYTLLKEMPFHKAFMLIGDGSNGKSTFLNLLQRFIGKENFSNVTLQELCYNRFASANLYGKMANISADLPKTAIETAGRFKMLTGGDTVSAEFKHKNAFQFVNISKMWYSCNEFPQTTEDTLAYVRRWKIFNCNNIFLGEKCDPFIIEKLTTPEELSGFLNYALEGLKRLLENGKFSINETEESLRDNILKLSNPTKAFLESQTEKSQKSKDYIPEAELYSKFILYCDKENLPTVRKGQFTIALKEYCPDVKQTNQRILNKPTPVYQFIKFKETVTPVTTVTANLLGTIKNPFLSEISKEQVTAVTESESNVEYTQLVCVFCDRAIMDNDFIQDDFSWGKPAHKKCYDDKKADLKQEGL